MESEYDGLARPTNETVTLTSGGTTEFSQTRGYDSVGNVASVQTTLPAGTDHQAFCYDEQNRLTWAGATGTPPCGASLTPGTLTSAQYTQSFTYDTLNRLQSGPAGSYAYTNSLHQDAATQISSGYTAAYDDAGDMQCRAPTSSLTCSGTQTGQKLTYDQLRRLTDWQNQTNSPTSTAHYAYDGEGERVVQNTSTSGVQVVTYYLGSYGEIRISGHTTTPTYYYAAGLTTLISVNGTLSYLVADGIGSASESLSPSGTVLGADLYAPYGSGRYSTGSLSTTKGFTGQLSDPSGLQYFHARYYDGVAGQFTSADMVQGPNRYGYVMGNPESNTDPTGQTCHHINADGENKCYTITGTSGTTDPPPDPFQKSADDLNGTILTVLLISAVAGALVTIINALQNAIFNWIKSKPWFDVPDELQGAWLEAQLGAINVAANAAAVEVALNLTWLLAQSYAPHDLGHWNHSNFDGLKTKVAVVDSIFGLTGLLVYIISLAAASETDGVAAIADFGIALGGLYVAVSSFTLLGVIESGLAQTESDLPKNLT